MRLLTGLLLCLGVAGKVTSSDNKLTQMDFMEKINPLKSLFLYDDMIKRGEEQHKACAENHRGRFETLKKVIKETEKSCLTKTNDIVLLMQCVNARTHRHIHNITSSMQLLKGCIDGQEDQKEMSKAEWADLVASMKQMLPAEKKRLELYIALENAKLSNNLACVHEFEPKLKIYSKEIASALDNCYKFVPRADMQGYLECSLKLTQPTDSKIDTDLLYIKSCWT